MPADQTPPLTTAELDALEAAAKSPRTGLDATVAMVLRLVAEVRHLRAASAAPAALVQAAEAVLLSAAKGGQGHAMDLLALERAVAKALQSASPQITAETVRELRDAKARDIVTTKGEWRARSEKAEAALAVEKASKDGAYKERNALVAALSKLFPASLERHDDADKTWEDDWRWIVFIDLPTGQASWHIHDSELQLFEHLPRHAGRLWDGHNNERKYERLAALNALQPATPAVELPRKAPPGTVRVRVGVSIARTEARRNSYAYMLVGNERPDFGDVVIVADVPLPAAPPVVQARVEPAPAKEGEVPRG